MEWISVILKIVQAADTIKDLYEYLDKKLAKYGGLAGFAEQYGISVEDILDCARDILDLDSDDSDSEESDEDEDNTYHKAPNNEIMQTDGGDAHIFMKWCPKEHLYTWYIETDYPDVAYFDIHDEDEEDTIWARCCVIDCSSIL